MHEQEPRPVEPDVDNSMSRKKTAVELIGFLGISSVLAATAIEASDFGLAYSVYPGGMAVAATGIACEKWKHLISPPSQD